MSDLIKKVKIKKQDGTFTDYIPIGAEAENVKTEDGMSVENKLKKKPYYFDTVADMKEADYLVEGDMAITLGYYEINDGGAGEYNIKNSSLNLIFYEVLNNTLYAELITGFQLNVKTIGVYGDNIHDDSIKIRQIIKKLYSAEQQTGWRRIRTIYFPSGDYIINNPLIDSDLGVPALKLTFTGDSRNKTN